jgi:AbrB family looped-hinge helix DNA binding protein
VKVTSKGQVTIPVEIRRALGIEADSDVEFELVGDQAILRPVRDPRRALRVLQALEAVPYDGPSTEELMALTRDAP